MNGEVFSSIGAGVVTLLGVGKSDSFSTAERLIGKILRLRLFPDEQGKMNRSLIDTQGSHLIVSQFTLYGDCHKGNRPSFGDAADPEFARTIYEHAVHCSSLSGIRTSSGAFQADMQIDLINDGPVTFILESKGD